MNYIQISGGLGNQMFQYTFGKYAEVVTGQPTILFTEFFDNDKGSTLSTPRSFSLDKFKTNYIRVNGHIQYNNTICEGKDEINPHDDNCLIKGYWQDKYYFHKVKDKVLHEFQLKDENFSDKTNDITDNMRKCESVSIHIRRTDYLSPLHINGFVILDEEYYKKAVNILIDKLGYKPILYIFSDDYDYISTRMRDFCGCKTNIVHTGFDYEDMCIMASAKHHIIANSTFSWWSAMLSTSPNRINIGPQKWFKTIPEHDIYEDDWITI